MCFHGLYLYNVTSYKKLERRYQQKKYYPSKSSVIYNCKNRCFKVAKGIFSNKNVVLDGSVSANWLVMRGLLLLNFAMKHETAQTIYNQGGANG
jgi:hypothetical protein